jgi:hypothetical protein
MAKNGSRAKSSTGPAKPRIDRVFYSWQSDLPRATNRNFILTALETAAEAIRADKSIEVEPVVDRDTQGVPGSPDISDTIFEKIEQAAVFLCDVSIINPASTDKDRPTPNPNVLLELGYALKQLGPSRIIMVMNKAFGPPEQLPFDLRLKRVLPYQMSEDGDRGPERRKLQKALEQALRAIFEGHGSQNKGTVIQPPALVEQAKQVIEDGKPNRVALATRYMRALADEVNRLAPDLGKADQQKLDEPLVEAINQTEDLVVNFSQFSEVIALMGDQEAAHAVYKGFGPILEGYNLPINFGGSFLSVQFDFHKFMGQELFLVFIGKLIAQDRWELTAELLREGIHVANADRGDGRGNYVSFEFMSEPIRLLEIRNDRLRLGKYTLFGHILNERHTSGNIGDAAPMEEIKEADFFLYLRSAFTETKDDQWNQWIPHCSVFIRGTPLFIGRAKSSKVANRLLPALNVDDIPTFRRKLDEAQAKLSRIYHSGGLFTDLPNIKSADIASDKLRR